METLENDKEVPTHQDKTEISQFIKNLLFRNYKPKSNILKHCVHEDLDLKQCYRDIIPFDMNDESYYDSILVNWNKDIDFDNLLCKDETWDLKRDLKKEMGKLTRRTQKSLNLLAKQELDNTDQTPHLYASMMLKNQELTEDL